MTNKENIFDKLFEKYRESLGKNVNKGTFQDFMIGYQNFEKKQVTKI